MQLFLTTADDEAFLLQQLRRAWPGAAAEVERGGPAAPGLVRAEIALDLDLEAPTPRLPFARQWLPEAVACAEPSVKTWSERVVGAVAGVLPDGQPWALHVAPHYGQGTAGAHRSRLIGQAVEQQLGRRRRHLRRSLRAEPAPFTPDDALVQLLLTGPETGWLSVAAAPVPYARRQLLSPYVGGEIAGSRDPAPPSRAFRKLLEAEQRLGRAVAAGESCVDLGASPGSWSHVALQRGARVTAVDRAPLRDDLMRHPGLAFVRGDAFRWRPESPVDWLLCDVIAMPERSLGLLLDWLGTGLARRFVVSIKFKGHAGYALLDAFVPELLALAPDAHVQRLCANHNEVCVFGMLPGVE